MKKTMTIAMIMIAAMAFSQMEITRNRVMGSLALDYSMQDKLTGMAFTVPGVGYEFEAKPNDMFKLYLYGDIAYTMTSWSFDGTAADEMEKDLEIGLDPKVKVYLPNNLFGAVVLPFNYVSNTAPITDAEALADMSLDAEIQFGFDNREIYIHGLTPWDHFEKGMIGYAFYNMGLMYSFDYVDMVTGDVESEDAEELASYFGVYGAYAHYMENMMVKPYLKYAMGMNDKVDEDGHLFLGLDFAKDFTETVNLEAGLEYYMQMPADSDVDGASHFVLGALVNYYVMPELDIFGGIAYWMDMTKDNDTDPIMTIKVGAEYTLNLLK
jgi:hypothetical protein